MTSVQDGPYVTTHFDAHVCYNYMARATIGPVLLALHWRHSLLPIPSPAEGVLRFDRNSRRPTGTKQPRIKRISNSGRCGLSVANNPGHIAMGILLARSDEEDLMTSFLQLRPRSATCIPPTLFVCPNFCCLSFTFSCQDDWDDDDIDDNFCNQLRAELEKTRTGAAAAGAATAQSKPHS